MYYLQVGCSRCGFAVTVYKEKPFFNKKFKYHTFRRKHTLTNKVQYKTRYPTAVFGLKASHLRNVIHTKLTRDTWYDGISDIKYLIKDYCYNLILKDTDQINIEYGMYSIPNL